MNNDAVCVVGFYDTKMTYLERIFKLILKTIIAQKRTTMLKCALFGINRNICFSLLMVTFQTFRFFLGHKF